MRGLGEDGGDEPVLCDDVVAEGVEEFLGPVGLPGLLAGAALLLLEVSAHFAGGCAAGAVW